MNATVIEPQEQLVTDQLTTTIHHIDVCPRCELFREVSVGVWVLTRCGISKNIEGFLPSPTWVSCKDCLSAKLAACTFCGTPRKRL